jgi:deazaflavin-dependent oxidoreductase (nitroreductase family)
VTSDDPRAAWAAAQEAIFEEIRTYGRPKTGFFAGSDVLLLGTKGAKSGEHRVSPLTFSREGERLIIVASKSGAPTNPAWFANLVANPIVTVETGGEKFEVRATAITAGPERDRLYAKHASAFPGFLAYEGQTSRVIPVVVLERSRPAIG